jgi:hypothetical protein
MKLGDFAPAVAAYTSVPAGAAFSQQQLAA